MESQGHLFLFIYFVVFWSAVPRLCLHAVQIPFSGILESRHVNKVKVMMIKSCYIA